MKRIKLTQGKYAIVDDDMYEELNKYKWCYNLGYAVRSTPGKPRAQTRMHREVNGTPDGLDTDHINGNKLDNRRANLRACTSSENSSFRWEGVPNKGISWFTPGNKHFRVIMKLEGKFRTMGYYETFQEAKDALFELSLTHLGTLPTGPYDEALMDSRHLYTSTRGKK